MFHDKYSKANSQSDAGSIRKGSYRLRIIFSNIILVNADLKCHTSYHRIHTLCGSLERFVLEFQIFKLENRSGLLVKLMSAKTDRKISRNPSEIKFTQLHSLEGHLVTNNLTKSKWCLTMIILGIYTADSISI